MLSKGAKIDGIAYRGESNNRLQFFCLPDFQSHLPLRLLLSHVNEIQLKRRSNNFHGLTIKMKRFRGLEPVKYKIENNYDVCILTEHYFDIWSRDKFNIRTTCPIS